MASGGRSGQAGQGGSSIGAQRLPAVRDEGQFRHLLTTHRLRVTPQRLSTWRALCAGPPHPSLHTLFELVAAELPTTTLRTVYESVSVFEQLGIVRLLHLPGGARVELEPVDHAHGYCERCHTIVNLAPAAERTVVTEAGEPFEVRIEEDVVFGICPLCIQRARE